MYLSKQPQRGYTAYIDAETDDLGTQMDVGVLVLEPGDEYCYESAEKEVAILLLSGEVEYTWNGERVASGMRPTACWHRRTRRSRSVHLRTASCICRPRATSAHIRLSCIRRKRYRCSTPVRTEN